MEEVNAEFEENGKPDSRETDAEKILFKSKEAEQNPVMAEWEEIGSSLSQKREKALEKIKAKLDPEFAVEEVDAEQARGLSREEAAYYLLSVLDLQGRESAVKFVEGGKVNYKVLAGLLDPEKHGGSRPAMLKFVREYGIGDLLAYTAVNCLEYASGIKRYGKDPKDKSFADLQPLVYTGVVLAQDSKLRGVLDTAKIHEVIDESYNFVSYASGGKELSREVKWNFLALLAEVNRKAGGDFFNQYLNPEKSGGLNGLGSVLYQLGKEHGAGIRSYIKFRQSAEQKYWQEGWDVIRFLGLSSRSVGEVAEVAGWKGEISRFLDYYDKQAQQIEAEKFGDEKSKRASKCYLLTDSDGLIHTLNDFGLVPPLEQRFELIDRLIAVGKEFDDAEVIEITDKTNTQLFHSLMFAQKGSWNRFLDRFIDIEERNYNVKKLTFNKRHYAHFKEESQRKAEVGRQMRQELGKQAVIADLDFFFERSKTAEDIAAQVGEALGKVEVKKKVKGPELSDSTPLDMIPPNAVLLNLGVDDPFIGGEWKIDDHSASWETAADRAGEGGEDSYARMRQISEAVKEYAAGKQIPWETMVTFSRLFLVDWVNDENLYLRFLNLTPADSAGADFTQRSEEFFGAMQGLLQKMEEKGIDLGMEKEDWEAGLASFDPQNIEELIDSFIKEQVQEKTSWKKKELGAFVLDKIRTVLEKEMYRTNRRSALRLVVNNFFKALYYSRHLSYSIDGAWVLEKAVNPELVSLARRNVHFGGRGVGIDYWLWRDPDFLVPVDIEIPKGGTVIVSAPVGAGKSTLLETIADSGQRLNHNKFLLAGHMAVEEGLRENDTLKSKPPKSDEEGSFFTHGVRQLAGDLRRIVIEKEANPKLRMEWLGDELVPGSAAISRTAIAAAARVVMKQTNPEVGAVFATHEPEDFYLAFKLAEKVFAKEGGDFGELVTYGINPIDYQPQPGRIDKSLGILAATRMGVQNSLVEVAQALQQFTEEGAEYDLSIFDESDIEQPAGENAGFTTQEDFKMAGFERDDLNRGVFAGVKECLARYTDRREATLMFESFAKVAERICCQADNNQVAKYHKALEQIAKLHPAQFEKLITAVDGAGEQLSLPFSKTSYLGVLKNIREYQRYFVKSDEFIRILGQLEKYLTFCGYEEKDIGKYRVNVELIGKGGEQVFEAIARGVREKICKVLVEKTVDWEAINKVGASDFQLDLAYQDKQTIVEGLLQGDYRGYQELIKSYKLPLSFSSLANSEDKAKFKQTLSYMETKEGGKVELSLKELKGNELLALLVKDEGGAEDLEKLLQLNGVVGEVTELRRSIELESVSISKFLSGEMRQGYEEILEILDTLGYATAGAGLIREGNTFAAFSKAEELGRDSFPVSFKGGVDLGLLAVKGDEYLKQDLEVPEEYQKAKLLANTGPNGFGKTSLAKLTTQMFFWNRILNGYIPAEKGGVAQDVGQVVCKLNAATYHIGRVSTHEAELLSKKDTLQRVINNQGKGRVFIFHDEPGTGVNSKDAAWINAAYTFRLGQMGAVLMSPSHNVDWLDTMDKANKDTGEMLGDGESLPFSYVPMEINDFQVSAWNSRGESMPYRILRTEFIEAGLGAEFTDSFIELAQAIEAGLKKLNKERYAS